jgi:hypothetical protein
MKQNDLNGKTPRTRQMNFHINQKANLRFQPVGTSIAHIP